MADDECDRPETVSVLQLACTLFAAYVRKNTLPAAEAPAALRGVYRALNDLTDAPTPPAHAQKPAVPVKKSIFPGYLVCLEDGQKLKMLKRYLRTRYGLSPEQYRAKWNLPSDYPMAAPEYTARRSAFAKKIGLGRQPARPSKRRE